MMVKLADMTRLLLVIVLAIPFQLFPQKPKKLDTMISNGGVFGFTLSPDGEEAFWVQSNGGRDTLLVMHAFLAKGKWSAPEFASFSGNPAIKDIDPVFAPDGNTLLFQSTRKVEGAPSRAGFDLWAIDKVRGKWGEPYHLGNMINTDESESFASMTDTRTVYFMKQNPDGKGTSDIYFSRFINGKYEAPENLGAPINTTFRESNPFISAKEDFLIYFSSDSTGFGEVDLFITFQKNGSWQPPVNLGQPINTEVGEFCPFYHERTKTLYFCRTRKVAGDRRVEDIYSIPFDAEKYRK